ncbi:MAG: DsbA family protein [Patescibacteria group bacterium]|nr:DsbA family protein [Patescibacteria group bacterium]
MSSDAKILLAIAAATVAVLAFIVFGSQSAGKPVDRAVVERNGQATGSASPKVTLTEFADFQCPACGQIEPLVNSIIAQYGDKLKFIYRNFPLSQHPYAFKAAVAAQAAGEQGKFWEYRQKLFDEQESLSDGSFEQIAKDLNLNLEKFNKDFNSQAMNQKVQADLNDAQKLNLSGTPSFFINGEPVNLASLNDLSARVKEAIDSTQ